jgi:rhodanese-related sulfurtransferase
MLGLALGTLMLKKSVEDKQIEPRQLLFELIQPTRYVSTDQVAKMIIQNDPSLELIDVRSASEFDKFTLPKAVNVPLDSLLVNKSNYFGIPGTKVVFISNDDIAADQAWILTKRLGYNSTYVMKGGLNCWMETIIDPKAPAEEESGLDFATYSFRKGAQLYFTGAKAENTETSKVKVEVQRRKKSGGTSGGC